MNQHVTTNHSNRLTGRTAIVTGASRGIGLAIAQRLAAEGARVCLTARKPDGLAEAAATLPADSVLSVSGRADDPEHRKHAVGTVLDQWHRLDILVNNAGINPAYGPIADTDLDVARKIYDVNVLAPLGWLQEARQQDPAGFANDGTVVNLSSVTAETPAPGIGLYGVSKAALTQLTRTLAAELGPQIRVNAVAPAVVKTQFARALYEGKEAETASMYPIGRLGAPEDVAAAVAYLASSDAAWVTGEVITLDGGLRTVGGTA